MPSTNTETKPMTKKHSSSQLGYARKRIILLSMLGILLTGALVGASTTLPMYISVRNHIEQSNTTNAHAQVAAIENQLSQYHIIANQAASQPNTRQHFKRYESGQLSLQQLREYNQSLLLDATQKIKDLAAFIRYTHDGKTAGAVGPLARHLNRFDVSETRFKTVALDNDENTILIRVSAPIMNEKNETIGMDVLYFFSDPFITLLNNIDIFKHQAELFVTNLETQRTLSYNYKNRRIAYDFLNEYELKKANTATTEKPSLSHLFLDDKDYTYIFAPFESHPLMLVLKVPSRSFYQAAYQDLQWAVGSILFMLIFGGVLGHVAISPLTRRLAEQADRLKQNTLELQIAANVFEHTHEAIVISDANLNILRVNQGFYDLIGIESSIQLTGRNLLDYISPDTKQLSGYSTFLSAITHNNSWRGEIWYQTESEGRLVSTPTLQSITAVKNHRKEVEYFIHIFSDISEQKAIEHQMKRQANIDVLTGLPNRGSMLLALKRAIHKCSLDKFCAVLFMDLDGFKPVNDQHGHPVGDVLLQQVAQRLREVVREGDFIGRYGGDEFLMIINQLPSKANSAARSQHIIEHLSQPYKVNDINITIGVSIGIAHFPSEGLEAEVLIQAADDAMYRAKQAGRNRYSY